MTSTYFTVIFYHLINKTVFVLEEIKHPFIFIYHRVGRWLVRALYAGAFLQLSQALQF